MESFPNNEQTVNAHKLTQSQLLIWTGQQLNPEIPLYNMAFSFDLAGGVEVGHFQSAFQALLDRSDALRTTFRVSGGIPEQVVLPSLTFELPFHDWSSREVSGTDLQKWLALQSQKKIDLGERSFDSALLKLSENRFIWFLNQHHLITDAWAVGVLFRAMAGLYDRARKGSLDEAPVLPSFRDYAEQVNDGHPDQKKEESIQYWKNKTASIPAPPQLYGYAGPDLSTRAERVFADLGYERSKKLRALTKETDIRSWTAHLSLFNIFATALFSFMYRVSGKSDLAIGTPAHNRTSATFKETAGLFMEFFPIAARLEEQESFGSLLQKVRTETNAFLKYARPGSGAPDVMRRFNVVLNYINAAFPDFCGIPATPHWIHPEHCDPWHHLRLQVYDFTGSGNIQLGFDLNCRVFDRTLRKRIPVHFLRLLDAFIEDRTQSINRPALIADAEIQSIASDLNENDRSHSEITDVVDLFEKQAGQTPDLPAIAFKGRKITYRELDGMANQLAAYLTEKGIGPGDRIGLFLKRSPELVVGVLAALKVNATYIPIAIDYPEERIAYMLRDAQPAFILTQEQVSGILKDMETPLVLLDAEWPAIDRLSAIAPDRESQPGGLAYIMYTSGSTGRPKGVTISRRALANYIQWAAEQYPTTTHPAMPLFTSIGFDLTVTSLFLPLVSGGSMIIYEENPTGPDLAILQVIEDNAVDIIKLTPSHLSLIRGRELPGSRISTMIVGGEDLSSELAGSIFASLGKSLVLYNEYGPTEATVGCIACQFDPEDKLPASVPIGRPITGMRAYVLDAERRPAPPGVPGELYLSGAGLSDGYLNRPDLTRERFVPDPFHEGSLMYRSGDMARLDRSGLLEFLGRADRQLKVNGMRVEPGEIESVINQFPGIERCVVEMQEYKQNQPVKPVAHCNRCGLPSNYPKVDLDEEGICQLCRSFPAYQQKVGRYFKPLRELQALFEKSGQEHNGPYDCIMLLSGGKDSTYALAQLVEMGVKVLAFTLDNGYISDQAKANIRRVVTELGVDHHFETTQAMNAIFVDSLRRHANVCDGCFKTIYTLSMKLALKKNIPLIVTGLSRGQFFETRLTEELFWDDHVDADAIDRIILEARKVYHRVDDAVKRLLNVSGFENDEVFEKVRFVDFYRYSDVSLEDMMKYLDERLPWIRPTDTGRSTNCLINQVGIFVHKKERGYSNYAFPYSWDVRIGHKTREASLEEINEEIDQKQVQRIMGEIGYQEREMPPSTEKRLAAYYTCSSAVSPDALRAYLELRLPEHMIPFYLHKMESFPLTANGKIDRSALPEPEGTAIKKERHFVAPETEVQVLLSSLWAEVLNIDEVGILDNFLDLGGNSLAAIRLMARIREAFHLEIPINQIFELPTVAELSDHIEETILKMLEQPE